MDTRDARRAICEIWKYPVQMPILACGQMIDIFEESQTFNRETLLMDKPLKRVFLDFPMTFAFPEEQ
jgi:hypothetical protein